MMDARLQIADRRDTTCPAAEGDAMRHRGSLARWVALIGLMLASIVAFPS